MKGIPIGVCYGHNLRNQCIRLIEWFKGKISEKPVILRLGPTYMVTEQVNAFRGQGALGVDLYRGD
jgi:hypothetical protein